MFPAARLWGGEDIAAQGGDEWKDGPREKGAHKAPSDPERQKQREPKLTKYIYGHKGI